MRNEAARILYHRCVDTKLDMSICRQRLNDEHNIQQNIEYRISIPMIVLPILAITQPQLSEVSSIKRVVEPGLLQSCGCGAGRVVHIFCDLWLTQIVS